LAQLLQEHVPLPDWVSEHLAYMFARRRLRPDRPLNNWFKRAAVIQAKHMYDNSTRLPGETRDERIKRVVGEFNSRYKQPKHHWMRVTDKAVKNLLSGRGRLAQQGQKQRKAEAAQTRRNTQPPNR